MKRAFTLVEMLIVVAILAVLMSIVFRLGSVGDEDSRRTTTVVRLQKIENCLSGYYAAFGSYPPVKVHGSRDIRLAVDENGDQDEGGGGANDKQDGEALVWRQVDAACRSQPFGCEYPGTKDDHEVIESWSEELKERVNNSQDYPNYAKSDFAEIFRNGFTGPQANDSGFKSHWDEDDWKAIKLFKFGMISYLLPRYLFMLPSKEELNGDRRAGDFFGVSGNACAQWANNNDLPCDPFEGRSFGGWDDVASYVHTENLDNSGNRHDMARVANIPSQAVCARWMPNLEESCRTLRPLTFFGVPINHPDQTGLGLDDEYPPDPGTHYVPGSSKAYKNSVITMYDGWGYEFYYYSPAPYQSYEVWSAGPNGKTFPPWMSIEDLNGNERKTAMSWKNDDIMQMSH